MRSVESAAFSKKLELTSMPANKALINAKNSAEYTAWSRRNCTLSANTCSQAFTQR
jgi:hypothetical protein